MTIQLSTTDKRDGRALALFAAWQDWQQGKTKDGRSFFAIPGSERGLFHMADQRECSCPDFQRARNVCKHVRAVRLWMAAYQTGAVAPKRRPALTTAQRDNAADHLVILTPEGAAYLAERYQQETAHGLASEAEIELVFTAMALATDPNAGRSVIPYADLFPECRVPSCTDQPKRDGALCAYHLAEQRRALANA